MNDNSTQPPPISRPLSAKQVAFISAYLGAAALNATKAARMAGYHGSDRTLRSVGAENLAKPDIQAEIGRWRADVRAEGIAQLEHRVAVLNDLHAKALTVIEARARVFASGPGGATGLLVRDIKSVGAGAAAHIFPAFTVDIALLQEIRALQVQAAKELGQWSEKVEQAGGVMVQIVGVDTEAL